MAARTLRAWSWTHKWSSLVSTLFLLVLCVTGLPLVFFEEIDHLSGARIEAPPMQPGAPRAALDAVVAAAVAAHPGKLPLYVFAEKDSPDLWLVKLDARVDGDERDAVFSAVDARSARVLGQPRFNEGAMYQIYRLHVDMFAGEAGRLFLGAMGLLLLVSVVSGIVLYAPFMRRLAFATLRRDRSPQLWWLDLHNLTGIATLVWVLVVGATGIINTWANQILQAWQAGQVAALKHSAGAGGAAAEVAGTAAPIQRAVDAALAAHRGMRLDQLAFPGTLMSTPQHYTVLLAGDAPLTARLRQPVLVQPASGRLTEATPRPAIVTALELSQPLHFGDYGGLPLKAIWALLDLIAIATLWSGLVLWWRKHRRPQAAPRADRAVP